MALIHHQFESIHPFFDGNGRLGRILNVLYLTQTGLLDTPMLYLSRHINRNQTEYYRLLQAVRDDGAWAPWVLYMLEAVEQAARTTLRLVEDIDQQMASLKDRMLKEIPRYYSQALLNNLFRHPYTRIDFMAKDLGLSRQTAARYLDMLAEKSFVVKHRLGRSHYFVHEGLIRLFLRASEEEFK